MSAPERVSGHEALVSAELLRECHGSMSFRDDRLEQLKLYISQSEATIARLRELLGECVRVGIGKGMEVGHPGDWNCHISPCSLCEEEARIRAAALAESREKEEARCALCGMPLHDPSENTLCPLYVAPTIAAAPARRKK
jgi:hypothetical protein